MPQPPRSNKKTALSVLAFALGMFALAYASFPLYTLFCKVTGYGGTPVTSNITPSTTEGTKQMTVRFNGDVTRGVPWDFAPVQGQVRVVTGENKLIFFKAHNRADYPVTGVATFNVTPEKAAQYFNKVHCFCFENQTLQPGESVEMPVSFFIDPAIEKDPYMDDVDTVTLSYSFYEAQKK